MFINRNQLKPTRENGPCWEDYTMGLVAWAVHKLINKAWREVIPKHKLKVTARTQLFLPRAKVADCTGSFETLCVVLSKAARMEKVVVISKPGCTTLRMLSGASGYFAFGAVPRTCRTQCLHFNQFRSGLLSSYSCHFGCSSRTAATATHLLQRTLKSVNVNSVSRLLNPRPCCQGSRNLTALCKFCASGETICLGEGETGQRTNQWQRKRAFRLPGLLLSLLPASSSREIFTCVSSSMVRDVLVGRLQSALTVWQPVRYKSKGKKSKSSDDEVRTEGAS